jgi:hypothetical protein
MARKKNLTSSARNKNKRAREKQLLNPNATWRRGGQQWREAQRAGDGGSARRGVGDDNVSISGSESRLDAVHANWTWR